ncbi:MAG TPA: preprotein translocase subunit SecG [Firmicutes bacterium]|nr:preprotein translocase subunit SecG [Bacillota bacterium]
MRTILFVLQFLVSIALIVVVTAQSSKGEGLGSIGGGAQLFFSANKGLEAFLNRVTVWLAVAFMVSSILVAVVNY